MLVMSSILVLGGVVIISHVVTPWLDADMVKAGSLDAPVPDVFSLDGGLDAISTFKSPSGNCIGRGIIFGEDEVSVPLLRDRTVLGFEVRQNFPVGAGVDGWTYEMCVDGVCTGDACQPVDTEDSCVAAISPPLFVPRGGRVTVCATEDSATSPDIFALQVSFMTSVKALTIGSCFDAVGCTSFDSFDTIFGCEENPAGESWEDPVTEICDESPTP